jgi:hypothetical protein
VWKPKLLASYFILLQRRLRAPGSCPVGPPKLSRYWVLKILNSSLFSDVTQCRLVVIYVSGQPTGTIVKSQQSKKKNLIYRHLVCLIGWGDGAVCKASTHTTARRQTFNPLPPNDIYIYIYIYRTAQLTSRRCILNIYSTNIRTEYFKHTTYSQFFSLQNAIYFIILPRLVPVLFTF